MDLDSVRAIISNRFHVMSHFARDVVATVYKEEKSKADIATRKLFKRSKRLLTKHEILMSPQANQRLNALLADSDALQVVYDFKVRLHEMWAETTANHENLLDSLQEWCQQAEASGIRALEDFARSLRGYTLQPA